MSKYIDAEKLKAEIQKRSMHAYEAITADEPQYRTHYKLGRYEGLRDLIDFIDSLQQEPIPDTDVLHTELVNLLKTYRIGEETARTMADRIADTYGAQKYMDGLCDGLDEEDTKDYWRRV